MVNDLAVQEFVEAIKETPTDPNTTYSATVSRIDSDGIVWVNLHGSNKETPTASSSSEIKAGDRVTVNWRNNKLYIGGNYSNPSAGVTTVQPSVDYVAELIEKDVTVNSINATTGYIEDLTSKRITAEDIAADHATIGELDATYATIENLNATNANVQSLQTNKADISDLNAATARIGTLEADHVSTTDLAAANAEITNLKSSKADISVLEANYATLDELHSDYAEIDLANVNNAWIQNGVIKNGAIADAQIIGVSANKLTAGTIDASNITVTNLNASNITTGSITVDGITIDVENNEASIDGAYVEDGTITMNGLAQSVKDVIDGAIETFTGTVVPTLNNTPASSWTTTALKNQHVGDVYYVVNNSSQQNGYCYRFTKSGSTYSWQLIKDSDVTAALQRLQTAEGKISNIESFDEEMATFKTETEGEISTLQTKTTSLETSLGDKVDKTTFNQVSQKVDENSARITTLSNTVSTKADSSTVTTLSNTVNNVSQKANANEAAISDLTEVVETKADGSTVSTLSQTVNSVQQTATSNSSKITSLTTTLGTNADGTTKAGDIVHRTSAVEQDLSGFKTTVSETYATKATVNGKADASTVYTKSEIDQTVSGINASVSAKADGASTTAALALKANKDTLTSEINASADTVKINANRVQIDGTATFNAIKTQTDAAYDAKGAAQTAVDGIEVGGRNLYIIRNSKAGYLKADSTDLGGQNATRKEFTSDYIPVNPNENVIFQNWVTPTKASGEYLWIAYQFYDSNKALVGSRQSKNKGANTGTLQHDYYSIMVPSGAAYLRVSARMYDDGLIKVEKGNKTTDWTPAPEDVDSAIGKANSQEQRIYYRSKVSGTLQAPTEWITKNTNQYNDTVSVGVSGWSTKVTPIASGTGANVTKYLYLYTCVQRKAVDGTITNTAVLLDDSTTVIDGGTIVTGSVAANSINANSGTFNTANIPNLSAKKITSGDIDAARIQTNVVSAINATVNKIDAKNINVGQITVGSLSDGSSYSTTDDMNTAIGNAVDAVEVGGRNYAKTNEDYNNPLTEVGLTATVTGPSTILLNGTATEARMLFSKRSLAFGGLTLKVGTYNLWFTNTSGTNLYFRIGKGTSATHVYSTPGEYTKDSPLTITVSSEDIYYVAVAVANGATFTNFQTSIMFEKGSKTTDWSPAPEDVQDEISGEARNLLRTTASRESPTEYHAYTIPTTVPLTDFKLGEKITVQLWDVVVDSNSTGVRVFWGGGNIPLHTSRKPDTNGYLSFTYTVTQAHLDDSTASNEFIRIYNVLSGHSGMNLTVGKWKLERGTRATDWTPSPEDVDADIAESAKTATTYITAIDNNGIRVHAQNNPTSNYAKIDATGMDIYKGGTSVAKYGDVARIGKASGTSRIELDYHSLQLINKEEETYLHVSDLRDEDGVADMYEEFRGDGTTKKFVLKLTAIDTNYTVMKGATEDTSVTKTTTAFTFSTAPTNGSEIKVYYKTAYKSAVGFTFGSRISPTVIGPVSFTAGLLNRATGFSSFAAGNGCSAYGHSSIALGDGARAFGFGSVAEGYGVARGKYSHAEGHDCFAIGNNSHAQGDNTFANYENQTVIGRYNKNKSANALEIGNGTSSSQSNAFEMTWEGEISSSRNGNVLWTGAYQMTNGQIATFINNQKISDQLSGVVLVWSAYSGGEAKDFGWDFKFIPKYHTAMFNGAGCSMILSTNDYESNKICKKYIYVYDDKIGGNAVNDKTGTGYQNNAKVLRYVLGV